MLFDNFIEMFFSKVVEAEFNNIKSMHCIDFDKQLARGKDGNKVEIFDNHYDTPALKLIK